MDIVVLILAFAASLVPSIALFFWLRNLQHDEAFKPLCNKALGYGALCVLPVFVCSTVFAITEGLLHAFAGLDGIPRDAYHTFFVLAFSEELVKCLCLFWYLKKYDRRYSWLDVIILMTIIGIGFGLAEDIPYALETNAIQMLVRGVDIGHGGYGFIMGYFLGKSMKTGNKGYAVAGFGLPWLFHGLYDFGLSENLLSASDDFAVISVSLALFSVIVIVYCVFFMRKRRNVQRFTEPLPR